MMIKNPTSTGGHRCRRWLVLLLATVALSLGGCSFGQPDLHWQLNASIRGHLPDLQFQLVDDTGQDVTASKYLGTVNILYFGYTHCPDVCPLTLINLHKVMLKLGPLAKHARILFVSVDPARDTPKILHNYVHAFDPRAVGLTGSEEQIRDMAKRYRVAFSRGPATAHGGYEVNHSSAIYVFDGQGRARLLATPTDSIDAIAHDVRQLIELEHPGS